MKDNSFARKIMENIILILLQEVISSHAIKKHIKFYNFEFLRGVYF